MNNRIVIIILTIIIIIQMITGIFIIRQRPSPDNTLPYFGMMEEERGLRIQGPHMRGNRFGRNFCEPGFMKEKLSLNQNQIDKISGLNKKFEMEFSGFKDRIDPEREKLKNMLANNKNDMNAIRNQLKKIEDINIDIHMLRIRQGKEISEILTPEQMNILHNERKLFFEKMHRNPGGFR